MQVTLKKKVTSQNNNNIASDHWPIVLFSWGGAWNSSQTTVGSTLLFCNVDCLH